jgi:energy-coupling factor transporter transmembrane protein EcfT
LWDFSIFEIGIMLVLFLTGALVIGGIWVFLRRRSPGKSYFTMLRAFLCLFASLVLVFSLSAINYSRDSIGMVLNLPAQEVSKGNLVKLSLILVEELTALTANPEWDYSLLTAKSAAYIEIEAVNSMKMLGKWEPSLAGYYPKPKPVYFSKPMSGLGLEGIYSPFTMEANYNTDRTSFLIPYTINHELAHLKGYMKEADAGFIAYLACKNSPSKVFQYSGFFHALIFSLNALKLEADSAEFNEIYQKLPEPVRFQLNYIHEQNLERDSIFTTVSKSVNHVYLKANAQNGTNSYGGIVDLLLSDYAERINGEDLL